MKIASFPIIFEDQSFLIINKPAGITVNRSETTKGEKTMQDFVEEYLGLQYRKTLPKKENLDTEKENDDEIVEMQYLNQAFYDRSGIVHRLDKETSGILVVAKTQEAFRNIQEQFKKREVKKIYLALTHGRVVPERGEINVPVGRLLWNRRKFGVVPGGRESVTNYVVKGYFRTNDQHREVLSLVQLHPLTGRTHQIRVHLRYIGHPIFADFLYAGRKTQREDRKVLRRVFLHASQITLIHPNYAREYTFDAPLPPELQKVLDSLVPIV